MQFTSEYHRAQNSAKTAGQALSAHWQSNPVKWKFWKRPPAEWKQQEAQLMDAYEQACLALRSVEDARNPDRANERYKALMFGGISAIIFFAGIIGLAVSDFFNNGQTNWVATISAVMTGTGAVGAIMGAFIFAE